MAVATVAGAAVVGIGAAAPAFAGTPPAGCTQVAPGLVTCTTVTTEQTTLTSDAPVNINYPGTATFEGFTGAQVCQASFPGTTVTSWDFIIFGVPLSLTESVTVTTTTLQHGTNGKVVTTSTSTSPPTLVSVNSSLSCQFTP